MTQEDKELLLKDLCARLPYGVKILHKGWNYEWDQELSTLEKITGIDEKFIYTKVIDDNGEDRHTISLFNDKPYLFPLSSMTEEQKREYHELIGGFFGVSALISIEGLTDFFNKNHIDYRGLIPMELAIDATGLNVY